MAIQFWIQEYFTSYRLTSLTLPKLEGQRGTSSCHDRSHSQHSLLNNWEIESVRGPEWCWQRFVLLDESLNISFESGRFLQGILFFIHVYTVKHGYDQMLARKEFHIEMEIRSFERQGLVLKSLVLTVCVNVFILPKQKETEWGFSHYYFIKERRGSNYDN